MLIAFKQVGTSRLRLSALPIVLLVSGWTGPVRAAEDPREAARAHYARGLELAGQADYEAALREFTEAYAVSPNFAVLYNIGQAEVALGRPAKAVETLSKYLRDGQDQVPPARRQQVEAQIALLVTLFSELTVTTDRPGVLIFVDGREIGRTPLYQPVRLAAGTHKISAEIEGTAAIDRTVTLGQGERQVLNLEMSASPAPVAKAPEEAPLPRPDLWGVGSGVPPQTAPATPGPSTARDEPGPGAVSSRRTMSTVGVTVASVGVALGAGALGVYLWNRGRYQNWQDNNAALQRDKAAIDYHARQVANNQLADSLTRANHVITGLSIAGGVLLAGGATLWFVDRARGSGNREVRADTPTGGVSLLWGWQGPSSGGISWSAPW